MENTLKKRNVLTVTELTRNIKHLLENNLNNIWVRGEVSNCRTPASGHTYFTLKDESSVIRAVLFRGYRNGIKFDIEDGMNVIANGNISVFEKRGEYQITVFNLEPEGVGALQLAFEQLKQKLMKEGVFDKEHKKQVPAYPDVVGLVTSETGAAIRDMLNVIKRRYHGVRLILYPASVQGENAAGEIAAAIQKANQRREVDVLIVGRGGGSLEDLWSFNEELVARAIYNSHIPIISAVGHEIDYTISDFTADLRAPTPSAAAELVVKNKEELLKWFRDLAVRLYGSIERMVRQKNERLSLYSEENLVKKMTFILNQKMMELDDATRKLDATMDALISELTGRFEKTVGQLNALSPLNTLSRGYAIVSKMPSDRPVFSVDTLQQGDNVKTRLKDGNFFSTVNRIENIKSDKPEKQSPPVQEKSPQKGPGPEPGRR
ncbi:MAG: exodeoxyribonuclease VII large subunit [Spirochaetota bacterium]